MNHNLNCSELLGSISEYVDGALQDEFCRELEKHISGCENCRIVVDTFKKTVSLYQTTSTDVPAEVRERLFKRLDLDEYAKKV